MGQKQTMEQRAKQVSQILMNDITQCLNHMYAAAPNHRSDISNMVWKIDMMFQKIGIDPTKDDVPSLTPVPKASLLSTWTQAIWTFHWTRLKKNIEKVEWALPNNTDASPDVVATLYWIRTKLHELDHSPKKRIKDKRKKK